MRKTIPSGRTVFTTVADASGSTYWGSGNLTITGETEFTSYTDFSRLKGILTLNTSTVASGAVLKLTVDQADGRTISGDGTIIISNSSITSDADLSNLAVSDLFFKKSGGVNVAVSSGKTLTLNVAQADGVNIKGRGSVTISDTLANLVEDEGSQVSGSRAVTIKSGAATIAQLTAIDGYTSGTVTYSAAGISDTAAILATNTGTYVRGSVIVSVSDAATIAQLTTIDGYTRGTVTYSAAGISDTAANLATNTGTYVRGAINVSVSDAATIAQLNTIDNYTSGTVTASSGISDTLANLVADAGSQINGSRSVTITSGAASIAQLTAIDLYSSGTVTYSAAGISDTAANLATNTGTYVRGAINVSVSDAATIAQLTAIDGYSSGTVTYSAAGISDTAAILVTNTGTYVTGAINVSVSNAATITQLTTIDNYTSGTVTASSGISDTLVNLVTDAGSQIKDARNVTITSGAATIEQLATIDRYNTTGTVTYSAAGISDTAENLVADALNEDNYYIKDDVDVIVTTAATIAELSTIHGVTEGDVDYSAAGISDTAENLVLDALNEDNYYIKDNVNVIVTTAATIDDLTTILNVTDGMLTYTDIEDDAANLVDESGAVDDFVTSLINVTVSDAATIAQLTAIYDVVGDLMTYTDAVISDTVVNLLADIEIDEDAGEDEDTVVYVTGSIDINITDAVSIDDLDTIYGATTGTLTYALSDTGSNIIAAISTLGLESALVNGSTISLSDTGITATIDDYLTSTDGFVQLAITSISANISITDTLGAISVIDLTGITLEESYSQDATGSDLVITVNGFTITLLGVDNEFASGNILTTA